eukprot:CAMPEP_0114324754 /NCGR_PEP_ID=MMETSP0059-20121206/28701_1 /TAXON_ID=36894 /ORGANISM="Pyramimonas parkeae, Strain CCMP726" /LENGTH=385 /DNA_ID=CAMNT_0001453365 /DNA_START=8 /DNA_END=1165 /DNA_ORIENTATION=+
MLACAPVPVVAHTRSRIHPGSRHSFSQARVVHISRPAAACLQARRAGMFNGSMFAMKRSPATRATNRPLTGKVLAATDSNSPVVPTKSTFTTVTETFSQLFPLWTILGAGTALVRPATFSFMTTDYFTLALSLLMFSMGITMTIGDFKRVLSKPGPVAVNFAACYLMMPVLALGISKMMGLPDSLVAGCVLVGSINGGQASNLCAYIAKGDVALSVIMTTATTVGVIFMTPLIAKLVLGTLVPVDAAGIVISTLQVVAAPIVLGVTLNSFAPKLCRAVEPICPVIGVLSTALQVPLIALHLIGGLAGYYMSKFCGFNEITSRTMAIETSMKSSAFGFLLASLHFSDFMVRVPSAVSVVWMALAGSTMAVIWRGIPIPEEEEVQAK